MGLQHGNVKTSRVRFFALLPEAGVRLGLYIA
jgi:hypothetical protein